MDLTWNWRRIVRIALRLLLILLALGLGSLLALELWAEKRLIDEIRNVRATGGTLSLEELLPHLGADEANASHTLNAAGMLLRSVPQATRAAFDARQLRLDLTAAPEDLASAEDWLAIPQHRLALEILDLGWTAEHARFVEGHGDAPGIAARSDNYFSLRVTVLHLVDLIKVRASVDLARGRPEEAFRGVAQTLRIARWLHEEMPNVASGLLGVAVRRRGALALEQLQQHAVPSAAMRRQLQGELRHSAAADRTRGLKGERAYLHQLTRRTGELLLLIDPNGDSGWWAAAGQNWFLGYLRLSSADTLALFAELIRRADQPAHLRSPLEQMLENIPWYKPFAEILIPNIFDSVRRGDIVEAHNDLALLSLAWSEYREVHGTYPDKPSDLAPELLGKLPPGPFSGEPYRYREEAGGCLLYSVGVNRVDDLGQSKNTRNVDDDEDDIAWRLPCASSSEPTAPR